MKPAKLISPLWWRKGMGGRIPDAAVTYRRIAHANKHYRGELRKTFARYLSLRRRGFSLEEMMLWGLLDPSLGEAELSQYVSKRQFLEIQARNSPIGHAALLEDKEVFYRYCEAVGIPVPQTVAYLSRGSARTPGTAGLVGEQDLRSILSDHDGEELILKPANGVYGQGLRTLKVAGDALMEGAQSLTANDLIENLPRDRRYILQRRVYNHRDLRAWTGVKTLQTLRIASGHPGRPGETPLMLSASWRSVVAETTNDNFNYGRTGNLRIQVNLQNGVISRAVRAAQNGVGLEDVECHPLTGEPLIGTRLPAWGETLRAVTRAASLFYPIRLVGWDVAITDDGPVLIEGNYWFDPDNAWGDLASRMSGFLRDA